MNLADSNPPLHKHLVSFAFVHLVLVIDKWKVNSILTNTQSFQTPHIRLVNVTRIANSGQAVVVLGWSRFFPDVL